MRKGVVHRQPLSYAFGDPLPGLWVEAADLRCPRPARHTVFPWEYQDKAYQAKTIYESPFRRANQALSEENLRLKRILRENGISWSPVAQAHLKQMGPTMRRSRQRKANGPGYPHLPPEVILRILRFALTGAQPIIDPLSPTTSEHLTEQEKARGNQIAIHFLATC
ncbi:hypothetical protein PCL_11307 [Purpureocillium lilacinum]|uniref:Uncharacterized protein n=1 Tax=Purpureocillium lilacinum TaxID=33203 RepID=A0A2U3DPW8_PURLI|nr:hypothetical protein PCL_11307 [Purpureocillium lilacinum]